MKKIRQILIGLFNMVYNIFLRYSQAVLLVIVVIVSTDVFCRNVLSYSIKWAQEVSLLLIVWMTFLSMAIGEEKDQHIAIELFYNLFPKPVRKFFDVLNKMILPVLLWHKARNEHMEQHPCRYEVAGRHAVSDDPRGRRIHGIFCSAGSAGLEKV